MELYKKYISNLLIKFFGVIILTFTSIVVLGQFLRLINKYIGKGTNLLDVGYMLTLFLPSLFIYISPIAIFCTIVFVYHKMINDNEFVIFEASGLSKYDIAKVSMQFAIIITLASYLVTTVINPLAKREFQDQKLVVKEGYISSLLEEKVFNNLTKKLTIYVDKKAKDNQLYGVVIYDNTKDKGIIISAERAFFVTSQNQMSIVMYNGTRQEINKHGQLDLLNFEQSKINLLSSQMQEINREYSPEEWLITDLIFNEPTSPHMEATIHVELHQRLAWPLLNLALTAIALSAISGAGFSRRWSSKSVACGVVAGSCAIFLHFAIENAGKHNHYLSILLYVNMIAFIYGSMYLLRKSSDNNNYFLDLRNNILKRFKHA